MIKLIIAPDYNQYKFIVNTCSFDDGRCKYISKPEDVYGYSNIDAQIVCYNVRESTKLGSGYFVSDIINIAKEHNITNIVQYFVGDIINIVQYL